MKKTRFIVLAAGLLLLLTLITAITACSGPNAGSQNTTSIDVSSQSSTDNSNGSTETHDFTLSGDTQPTLIVNNDVGSVNVQPDSNSKNAHVKVTKSGASPSDIQVNYSQSGNTMTVKIKRTNNTNSNAKADIDITLPSKVTCNFKMEREI